LASIVFSTDLRWIRRLLFCLAILPLCASAQKSYTYVGDIGPDHVLIAWGTTTGDNTIGRSSASHGRALLRIAGQELAVTDKNYAIVRNLQPDTEYEYELQLSGRKIGQAKIRTWPLTSEKLRFFVIGDFGSGDSAQQRIAGAMWAEFQKNWGDNPVRFVITTGDNIYGALGFTLRFRDTGDEDTEWEAKFFGPYENLIARIPFYPSLGNHDGNETEARADLPAYLDNFFFPGNTPGRYYRFSYGGLADFFALDSTTNSEEGPPQPAYLENSEQHQWLTKNMAESQVPWKIPYFHHPPFNAGPRHPAVAKELKHFIALFKKHGVRAVFNGHEHNFQFSQRNGQTGDIRYIVSGAGGELRTGDIRGAMQSSQIEGWAAKLHYLLVEIEGKEMRITPKSFEPFEVVDRSGRPIGMPLKVTIP
jgi:tartrate-resistant acid phosphatase type 5